MAKIKKEDDVIVIAGKDVGKRGKVRQVLVNDRLIVAGVNMVKKHTKANPQMGVAGGIVEREAPIHLSNVAIFNPDSGKSDRVGYKIENSEKIRVFKSDGKPIGQ